VDGGLARVTTSRKERLAVVLRAYRSFGDACVADLVGDLVSLASQSMCASGCSVSAVEVVFHELVAKACSPSSWATVPAPGAATPVPAVPTESARAEPTVTAFFAEVRLAKTNDGNIVLDLSEVPAPARLDVQAYFGGVLARALLAALPQAELAREVPN